MSEGTEQGEGRARGKGERKVRVVTRTGRKREEAERELADLKKGGIG